MKNLHEQTACFKPWRIKNMRLHFLYLIRSSPVSVVNVTMVLNQCAHQPSKCGDTLWTLCKPYTKVCGLPCKKTAVFQTFKDNFLLTQSLMRSKLTRCLLEFFYVDNNNIMHIYCLNDWQMKICNQWTLLGVFEKSNLMCVGHKPN